MVNAKVETSGFIARMKANAKATPSIVAKATNIAAARVARAERDGMKSSFRDPKPYTLNALRISYATSANLVAVVSIKNSAQLGAMHYLWTQIYGGTRDQKRFESLMQRAGGPVPAYFMPGAGIPKVASGMISRGTYASVLSQLQAQTDRYQNESKDSRDRRHRKEMRKGRKQAAVASDYFQILPGQKSHLRPSIYQRWLVGTRSSIKPVFIRLRGAPHYKARYPFFQIAEDTFAREFKSAFEKARLESSGFR